MSILSSTTITRRKSGFTLVELLVVIVIIGILASLSFLGGRAAIRGARQGVTTTQVNNLASVLDKYKDKFGEYPPDFSNTDEVMQHVRKRWKHYDCPNFAQFCADVKQGSTFLDTRTNQWYAYDLSGGKAAHMGALAFWVAGLVEVDSAGNATSNMLGGFSLDPSDPLNMRDAQQVGDSLLEASIGENIALYPFGGTGTQTDPILVVPAFTSNKLPMVYFRASNNKYLLKGTPDSLHFEITGNQVLADMGCAVPYAMSGATPDTAVWYNAKSFQLIHPGLDGQFGDLTQEEDFRVIDPVNTVSQHITFADEDNQANFNGGTISAESR